MKIYGLTGNIGSGKSTVARMLRGMGFFVVDADEVAREIVRPGEPALSEIVSGFGKEILRPDGSLDREALAQAVFSSPRERRRLESITHPRILERVRKKLSARSGERTAFVEAPLFDPSGDGLAGLVDGLVVVTCPAETRERRVCARDGMSPAEARRRMDSQVSEEEKAAQADFLVENSSDLKSLGVRVRALLETLGAAES